MASGFFMLFVILDKADPTAGLLFLWLCLQFCKRYVDGIQLHAGFHIKVISDNTRIFFIQDKVILPAHNNKNSQCLS